MITDELDPKLSKAVENQIQSLLAKIVRFYGSEQQLSIKRNYGGKDFLIDIKPYIESKKITEDL